MAGLEGARGHRWIGRREAAGRRREGEGAECGWIGEPGARPRLCGRRRAGPDIWIGGVAVGVFVVEPVERIVGAISRISILVIAAMVDAVPGTTDMAAV